MSGSVMAANMTSDIIPVLLVTGSTVNVISKGQCYFKRQYSISTWLKVDQGYCLPIQLVLSVTYSVCVKCDSDNSTD